MLRALAAAAALASVPFLFAQDSGRADVSGDPPAQTGGPINVSPPPPRFVPGSPLRNLPSVILDTYGNGFGTANKISRDRNMQARVLWVDATANISRTNTEQKIIDWAKRIKDVGFNTVVIDIKPISGQTIYPSRYAPKLEKWRDDVLPKDFDPLAIWVRECKKVGLSCLVSLNAFSEGHTLVGVGPGYDRLDWQTVLYEPNAFIRSSFQTRPTFSLHHTVNQAPPSGEVLGVFTEITRFPARPEPNSVAVILDGAGIVLAKAEGSSIRQLDPNLPTGGSFVLGVGRGAEFLKLYAQPGDKMEFDSTPSFVKISERPAQQYPLMMNPNNPVVQQRMIDIVKEVVGNYAIDGLLFDDRLRYGGMNADFSDLTKRQFEDYLRQSGQVLRTWPEDVFKFTVLPNLSKGLIPGPYYEAWLTFRAQTITNFLVKVRQAILATRPGTLFGVYAGSWYGEYPAFGSNYASNDFPGAFWFLRPEYQQTGYAGLLDILITGCYYRTATIAEAMSTGTHIGVTVEAGGQQSNRAAGDMCWTYAGIALSTYRGDTKAVARVLQAAVASTQGVMVFDLSHDIEQFWPVFQQAFALEPKTAPHQEKGLLEWLRAHRDPRMLKLPAILFGGSSGTGL